MRRNKGPKVDNGEASKGFTDQLAALNERLNDQLELIRALDERVKAYVENPVLSVNPETGEVQPDDDREEALKRKLTDLDARIRRAGY